VYALWLRHNKHVFSTVARPPLARGMMCSNSTQARSLQRTAVLPTNVHRPPSRMYTARLTAAGTTLESLPAPPPDLGFRVTANFFLTRSSINTVNARSMTAAMSPLGLAGRNRSRANSSFSRVSALAVNVI
jgi:hypothetical protein